MLEDIAQEICEQASKIINSSVLITNQQAIIIGSSHKNRLGTFHEASVETIKYCRQVFHDEESAAKLEGTRPGTTMPIVIDNQVVGTVGITGTPAKVLKYGNLIKIFAEMFVRTDVVKNSAILKNKDRLELFREIVTCDGSRQSVDNIVSHGNMLGFDMTLPRAAVYVDYRTAPLNNSHLSSQVISGVDYHVIVKQKFPDSQDIRISIGDERYVVFVMLPKTITDYAGYLKERCHEMAVQMKQCGFSLVAGIGSEITKPDFMRRSYEEAKLAWEVALDVSETDCLYIGDFNLEKLIYRIPHETVKNFCDENLSILFKQKDFDELCKMVRFWCESAFNQTAAAQLLNIHKNTLCYRMERFRKLTGFDLHKFNDAVAAYIALLSKK